MLNFRSCFLVDTKQLLIGTSFQITVILRTFESSEKQKSILIAYRKKRKLPPDLKK